MDGTKKLKWSGVPDVLHPKEVEAARQLFQARGANKTRTLESSDQSPTAGTEIVTEHPRDPSPTVTRKVLRLDSICVENSTALLTSPAVKHLADVVQPASISGTVPKSVCSSDLTLKKIPSNSSALSSLGTNHVPNIARASAVNAIAKTRSVLSSDLGVKAIVKSGATLLPPSAAHCAASIVSPITMIVPESGSAFSSSGSGLKADTNPQANFLESCLPLSCPGHSIVIKLPKSRFRNSLIEDLEDVRSFLNENERKYEERLISAVKALVEKHELLDKKLQAVEGVVQENSYLQAKVLEHKKTLLENHKLKEKLYNYETRAKVEDVLFRRASNNNSNPIITVQGMENTQQGKVCHITLQEGAFTSLDDQL